MKTLNYINKGKPLVAFAKKIKKKKKCLSDGSFDIKN